MPVVKKTSNLYRDVAVGAESPDPLRMGGYIRRATGLVTNAADDLLGSTYRLISLPGYVILGPGTLFHVANWGFADVRIGTLANPAVLVTATKISATTQSPIDNIEALDGRRLWELVGAPDDPMAEIHLFASAPANATGAGEMRFAVEWIDNI